MLKFSSIDSYKVCANIILYIKIDPHNFIQTEMEILRKWPRNKSGKENKKYNI